MSTKFPLPQEILDHPSGHLAYNCKPVVARGMQIGWNVALHVKCWPCYWNSGTCGSTPIAALELAVAKAMAVKLEHPTYDGYQFGKRTLVEQAEIDAKARIWNNEAAARRRKSRRRQAQAIAVYQAGMDVPMP